MKWMEREAAPESLCISSNPYLSTIVKLKVLNTFENLINYFFKYSFKVSFTELKNLFLILNI